MKIQNIIDKNRIGPKRIQPAVLQALKDLGGKARIADIAPRVYEILNLSDQEINYQYPNRPGSTVVYHRLLIAIQQLKHKKKVRLTEGKWRLTDPSSQAGNQREAQPSGNNAQILLNHLQRNLDKSGINLETIIKRWLELKEEYKDIKKTSKSKDGGIDLRAKTRVHGGLGVVVIQVKNYSQKLIDVKEIRAIKGLASGVNDYAWFITTSRFTRDAQKEAQGSEKSKAVKLTDGLTLAKELIESDIELKYVFPNN